MKKTVIMAVVMFLVVSSMVVLAQEEETADCNFWCKVSRFLFGNPENRAGKGWFERRAVVN